jgi:glycosyltransferase involved in cell wall biosynthesis
MRILIAHNRYQQMGGEDVVFDFESKALEDAGHDVERFVMDNSSIQNWYDKARVAINVSNNKNSVEQFRGRLESFNPDIVHFHNFFPLITPAALSEAASSGLPTIQTLHNYRALCANGLFFRDGRVCQACTPGSYLPAGLHRCYRGSVPGSLAVGRMGQQLRKISHRFPKLITFIAMTKFSKSRFVKGGFDDEQIVIKEHAIMDPGDGNQSRERKILFVGRLSHEKGADLLCRVAPRIDAEFIIIGGGPEYDALARIKPHNVTLLGPLPREVMFKHMKSATAVAVPSRWFETGPLTVLEAFATGTPVVASDLGTPTELVTHGVTGLLAAPDDDVAWENAFRELLSSPDATREMGRNARAAYLQRFTEEANLRRLTEIYEAAIEKSRASCA